MTKKKKRNQVQSQNVVSKLLPVDASWVQPFVIEHQQKHGYFEPFQTLQGQQLGLSGKRVPLAWISSGPTRAYAEPTRKSLTCVHGKGHATVCIQTFQEYLILIVIVNNSNNISLYRETSENDYAIDCLHKNSTCPTQPTQSCLRLKINNCLHEEPTPPTLHCKTHSISLRNISCSSLFN